MPYHSLIGVQLGDCTVLWISQEINAWENRSPNQDLKIYKNFDN